MRKLTMLFFAFLVLTATGFAQESKKVEKEKKKEIRTQKKEFKKMNKAEKKEVRQLKRDQKK